MRTWKMEVGALRKIGRPKLGWSDVIRKYMKEKQVKIEDAQEPKNVEIENLMCQYQIGKRQKKFTNFDSSICTFNS